LLLNPNREVPQVQALPFALLRMLPRRKTAKPASPVDRVSPVA